MRAQWPFVLKFSFNSKLALDPALALLHLQKQSTMKPITLCAIGTYSPIIFRWLFFYFSGDKNTEVMGWVVLANGHFHSITFICFGGLLFSYAPAILPVSVRLCQPWLLGCQCWVLLEYYRHIIFQQELHVGLSRYHKPGKSFGDQ